MIRGDATSAYGDTLARAWRDVVYLKPDVFVIFDDLIGHPVRCQRNFEWLLHSECELHEVERTCRRARGTRGPRREGHAPHRARLPDRLGAQVHRGPHDPVRRPQAPARRQPPPVLAPQVEREPAQVALPALGPARRCRAAVRQHLPVPGGADGAGGAGRRRRIAWSPSRRERRRACGWSRAEETIVLFNHAARRSSGEQTDAEKLVLRVGDGRKRPTADVPDAPRWVALRATRLVWRGVPLV